jgi:cobalt-precorrin-6B (C15)-methyltransferase
MIKDNDFIKDPDIPGPTKEEIRCLVLCKSQVTEKDTVVDIGCGTGGLTVEFARRAGKVYAVDQNPEALKITRLNLEKFQLSPKVEVVDASAPQVLEDLPEFDILLVGGSSGKLSQILKEGYKKLNDDGRIIVTSILLETRVEAVATMKELGLVPEVVEVSISRGRILERGTLLTAQNPITIISTQKI